MRDLRQDMPGKLREEIMSAVGTVGSSPWYRSLDRSQWKALIAANRQRGARLDMNERYANRSARAADDAIDLVFEQRQVGTGCEDEGAGKPGAQEREE